MNAEVIKQVRNYLALFYSTLAQNPYYSGDALIDYIMERRKYSNSPYFDNMLDFLMYYRPIMVPSLTDVFMLYPSLAVSDELLHLAGLIDDKGMFTLSGGYIFPAFNFGSSEIIGFIAWQPQAVKGKYKYSSTVGFSPKLYYYNPGKAVQVSYNMLDSTMQGSVYVVEGIFDSISIASLGLPVLGMLGREQSPMKQEVLRRFRKVIFIPDNDSAGAGVNPLSRNKGAWAAPVESTVFSLPPGLKDVDDFIKTVPTALEQLCSASYTKYCYIAKR